MLFELRFLRSLDIFLKPCLVKPKKRQSQGLYRLSTSVLDSLAVKVLESHLFSSNFVWLALVAFWALASLVGLVLSWKQCDPNFRLFGFFRDENGQEVFLQVFVLTKKIWHERKLAMKQPDWEQFTRTNIKYHTTIRITCDNWQWSLLRAVNAP